MGFALILEEVACSSVLNPVLLKLYCLISVDITVLRIQTTN